MHQRIRDADPDDRTDEGVRARCGQAEIPGTEIPNDRREQQREDHGEARTGADLQYQLDRQQRDDAERNSAAGDDDSEEIETTRPDHRNWRRHRMGIDHRGDGVGRVMEAVDELEPERDQQRHEQQKEWQVGRGLHARGVDVDVDAVRHVENAGSEESEEQDRRNRVYRRVELRFLRRRHHVVGSAQRCGNVGHGCLGGNGCRKAKPSGVTSPRPR